MRLVMIVTIKSIPISNKVSLRLRVNKLFPACHKLISKLYIHFSLFIIKAVNPPCLLGVLKHVFFHALYAE